MPTVLERRVVKRSTLNVSTGFKDIDDNPITPNSIPTFTLTDGKGNVVNNRLDVALPQMSSVVVSLYGDDTDLPDSTDTYRQCLVEATYLDPADNQTKPIRNYFAFYIHNADEPSP